MTSARESSDSRLRQVPKLVFSCSRMRNRYRAHADISRSTTIRIPMIVPHSDRRAQSVYGS